MLYQYRLFVQLCYCLSLFSDNVFLCHCVSHRSPSVSLCIFFSHFVPFYLSFQFFCIAGFLSLALHFIDFLTINVKITQKLFVLSAVNPCCYYPCQNSGVCLRFGTDSYQCDCTRTGFYGKNCTIRKYRHILTYVLLWIGVNLKITANVSLKLKSGQPHGKLALNIGIIKTT